MREYQTLTAADAQHFLERGYVVVRDCLPAEIVEKWTRRAWTRLGYGPDEPEKWEKPRIHIPNYEWMEMKVLAPKAWAAACDLLGGEERIEQPQKMWDGFIINLNQGADRHWEDPSPSSPGWHKDGDFFRHFLDSPEQGLLTLVYWSDVEPRGGGTFVACDSVKHVARYLLDHPEGTVLKEFNFSSLIPLCHDFVETTARTGDIFLLHPFILHASSQNLSGRPRFLTNPPIGLKEPMNFHRGDPDDYSLVELSVLQALGAEYIDYNVTGERGRIETDRHRLHRQMLAEQKDRLEAAGATAAKTSTGAEL
jgi:hypothetical protein